MSTHRVSRSTPLPQQVHGATLDTATVGSDPTLFVDEEQSR
jgi:hypothetical protein